MSLRLDLKLEKGRREREQTLGVGDTEDVLGSFRVVNDDDGEEGATPLTDDASILFVPALGELETLGTRLRDVECSVEPVLLGTRNEVCHGIVVPWKDKHLFCIINNNIIIINFVFSSFFLLLLVKRCDFGLSCVLRA